jgi:TPP-dependent pyruvate/acetoin dehydrogenase alpha subunit
VFVCENNEYAASTHISLNLKIENIAQRAESYGIPGKTVDGMDVQAVYASAKEAVERARKGEGPTLLEYKTYRFMGHSRGDPGGYRSREEVEAHKRGDPIANQRKVLAEQYGCEENELAAIMALPERSGRSDRIAGHPEPELRIISMLQITTG